MTTNEMQQLIERADETRNLIKAAIRECLVKLNATDEEHGLEFDWEEDCAPSYPSTQFSDDLADSFVTKIWLDGELIKVNLHAYYVGDDRENIDLADETCVDWEDILSNLLANIIY